MTDSEGTIRVVGEPDSELVAAADRLESRRSFEFATSHVADPARAATDLDGVDCVVSAYRLPAGDGLELLAAVRERHPDLPFILFVGAGDEDVASRAVADGATDYVRGDVDAVETILERRVSNAAKRYSAERKHRRSHLALETAQEGICLLDEDGRFTYVNPVYAETYGYEREEMHGEHWAMLYPDGDTEHVHDHILPEVYEEGAWSGETTGLRSDGSTFPEQHALAATDDGGLVCVVRDVSEQKRQVRELREREHYLRRLYDVTADAKGFEETLQRLFELGRERFDLEVGCLSRIDDAEDRFEVQATRGDHDHLVPGKTLPLTETYCRTLADGGDRAAGDLAEVTDPVGAGLSDTVAYEEFGVESYLGTCIRIDGELYGSFFFVSGEERDREFTDTERTFLRLMGEWVRTELERERHEQRLETLNDVTRELMQSEDVADLGTRFVEAAETTLDLPSTAVALLDEESGALDVVAHTERGRSLPLSSLCDEGVGWEAFVRSETLVEDAPAGVDADELVAVPLGTHGVLLTTVGHTPTVGSTREFVETVGSTLSTVLDRTDRERLLQQREETLAEQNEALERLNRVNDIIRSIDQGLVSASSRQEIEEVVCRHLGNRGPYELAWVGERDETSGEVVPREWHGNEKGYLDEVSITVDATPTGEGPAGRALKTREPQVVDDVLTDPTFEPWRQHALNRGYRSTIALPLTYRESAYGVLSVYAGQPKAFSELERAVLADLSETIAYAIDAVETKRGLVSDRVVELEFGLSDVEAADIARELGADLSIENVVGQADGDLRAFITARGVSGDEFADLPPCRAVRQFDVVAEQDDACLLEATLTEESLHARVLDHGGVVCGLTATPSGATVRIAVPASRDARDFVETLSRLYPDAELLAKREREREAERPAEFRAQVESELTDRQLEALQTAYFSGFFETPRHRTGTEVADSLGVSQPTFNNHLRAAHRKVFDLLFGEGIVGAE